MSESSYFRQTLPIPGGEIEIRLVQDRPLHPGAYSKLQELVAVQEQFADLLRQNEDELEALLRATETQS